jgi:hypothetical protein
MPAIPQQMSDNAEKSDDLIAELAKLMASDGHGAAAATGPKPTVIKLPPLGEPSVPTPGPVRIPGMEPAKSAPAASAPRPEASAGPSVRIPGMERPAGVSDPVAPPAPRPTTQFDFGRPPAAAPVIKQEPLANWQSSEVPRNLTPPPAPRPAPAPVVAAKVEPSIASPAEAKAAPTVTRVEPRLASAAPVVAPQVTPAPAKPAPAGDSFGFDFGFSGNGGGAPRQEPPAPANDPIADLIAAGLDDDAPEEDDAGPAPAPVAAAAQSPAAPAGARLMNALPQRPISIKPVSISPRPAEDKFSVAPVFGVGSKPVPAVSHAPAAVSPPPPSAPVIASPKVELDPMDEIENLIGEAVRVELSNSDQPRPAAMSSKSAPVVPPLNTAFAPRRSNLKDTEPQVQSAEAAILAAAAASGAEVGRVDAQAGDDRPYKRMKVKPPRTSGLSSGARQYVGIAVAGTLLLASGFGLYWVLGMNRADPGSAPVLTADVTPAKVEPSVPAPAATTQASGSAVFNEIEGVAEAPEDEALVSRDETAGASVTEVASISTPAADEPTETGLANRKVRTVTVRPDGTIVSGDDAVAGSEALPVDRPNVPEIAGSDVEPSELLTAVAETEAAAGGTVAAGTAQGGDALAALVAETGDASATPLPDPAPLEVAAADPSQATPAVFDGSLVSPIPMPRPANRASLTGSGPVQLETASAAQPVQSAIAPASTPLVAVSQPQEAAPASTQVSSRGGAYVQLSSQKSESDAAQSLRTTQNRMAGSLNGAALEIRRVDLGAKGIWYRVVLPVNSFQDATQTCAAIKSSGGDCVAING